eukprot:9495039-Pyramimonas_sp.AAC.1
MPLETTTNMALSLTKVPERPPQNNWQTAHWRNRTDCSRRSTVQVTGEGPPGFQHGTPVSGGCPGQARGTRGDA